MVSDSCSYTYVIYFYRFVQITDQGVCLLVPHVKLTCLVISGIHSLTDKTIFAIANCLDGCLASLYISGCFRISPHVVQYLKVSSFCVFTLRK